MTELTETTASQEGTRTLPDQVTRQLLVVRGRSGLLLQELDKRVVENQRRFGHDPDDYAGIVQSHQNTSVAAKVLGVHEEVRRRRSITIDGTDTEFVEASPKVKNVWVGEHAELFTPDEAAARSHGGRTALDWATQGGPTPEMVVRANDGYFYPAKSGDVVISTPIK